MLFRKNETVKIKPKAQKFYGIKENTGKVKEWLSPIEPFDYVVILKSGFEIYVTRWDISA